METKYETKVYNLEDENRQLKEKLEKTSRALKQELELKEYELEKTKEALNSHDWKLFCL